MYWGRSSYKRLEAILVTVAYNAGSVFAEPPLPSPPLRSLML